MFGVMRPEYNLMMMMMTDGDGDGDTGGTEWLTANHVKVHKHSQKKTEPVWIEGNLVSSVLSDEEIFTDETKEVVSEASRMKRQQRVPLSWLKRFHCNTIIRR